MCSIQIMVSSIPQIDKYRYTDHCLFSNFERKDIKINDQLVSVVIKAWFFVFRYYIIFLLKIDELSPHCIRAHLDRGEQNDNCVC